MLRADLVRTDDVLIRGPARNSASEACMVPGGSSASLPTAPIILGVWDWCVLDLEAPDGPPVHLYGRARVNLIARRAIPARAYRRTHSSHIRVSVVAALCVRMFGDVSHCAIRGSIERDP